MKDFAVCTGLFLALSMVTTVPAVGQTGRPESVADIYLGAPGNSLFITPYVSTGQRAVSGARTMFIPGKDYFILFPDGRLRRNLPMGGLDQFDAAQDRANSPINWGMYEVAKNKIIIRWPGNKNDFIGERAPSRFTYQSNPYVLLPKTGGGRLEGTFKRADSKEPTPHITFRRDGTFQESGIGTYIPAMDSRNIAGGGTYRIRNYSLYLDYADGRHRKLAYYLMPGDSGKEQPSQIVLNTYELSRNATTDPAVADLDGDGKSDILVSGRATSSLTYICSRGNSRFEAPARLALGGLTPFPGMIVVADFNRDGRRDIAVLNKGNSSVTLLYGKKAG